MTDNDGKKVDLKRRQKRQDFGFGVGISGWAIRHYKTCLQMSPPQARERAGRLGAGGCLCKRASRHDFAAAHALKFGAVQELSPSIAWSAAGGSNIRIAPLAFGLAHW